jgi:exodeoxyribonuclease VII large subunit
LRIAVVTSPRGKAIHDVVRTLKRRYPVAELMVAGVAVEGAGAVEEIVEGLRVAGSSGAEIALLVRGGGSYEDLMPFNAEAVARAVAGCPVPVVTGIGHEPDTSIADMVADVRASTPTAAAEASAPSIEQMSDGLDQASRHLGRALLHRVREAEHRVAVLARRPVFSDCNAVVGLAAQRLDVASQSLHVALPNQLRRDRDRMGYAARALAATGPRIAERAQESVALAAARLDDLSPLKVLGRGWSMCFADDGATVVRSIEQVAPGSEISVRVEDGKIGCRVETTEARETHE